MPYIKWTYALLANLFAEKGYKLLAKKYTTYEAKYDYECKCGNSQCSITIGNLKLGKDNCKPCSLQKLKATNLKKYGCESAMQNLAVQEKAKGTNIKKFGCEYPMQNAAVQEKHKAACLENFGCEYPMQNAEVQEKMKATNFKNLT